PGSGSALLHALDANFSRSAVSADVLSLGTVLWSLAHRAARSVVRKKSHAVRTSLHGDPLDSLATACFASRVTRAPSAPLLTSSSTLRASAVPSFSSTSIILNDASDSGDRPCPPRTETHLDTQRTPTARRLSILHQLSAPPPRPLRLLLS